MNSIAEMMSEWNFFQVSYLEPGEIGTKVLSFSAFLYATHVPAVSELAADLADDGYEIESNRVRLIRQERPSGRLAYFLDGQVCFCRHLDAGKLVVKVTSPVCEQLETAVYTAKAIITAVKHDGTVGRGHGLQQRLATIAADLVARHGQHLPEAAEVVVPYWTAKGRGGSSPVKALRRFAVSELN